MPRPSGTERPDLDLLDGVRFVDTGDVYLPPTAQPEVSFPLIGSRLAELLRAGLFPVVLGGDHSITYPLLLGVERVRGERTAAGATRPLRRSHGLLE